MKTLLIILSLFISELKLTVEKNVDHWCSIDEIAFMDKEDNNDIGTQENNMSDHEEEYPALYPVFDAVINTTAMRQLSLKLNRPASGLANKPFTPPDLT